MTKQFYLYLDESGDFDKDLLEAWKMNAWSEDFL